MTLRVICNIVEKLYMQSSNNMIILVSVILIISIATITLTLTNNIYALQENSNLNLTTTFTTYFSLSTAAAEEEDDEDDISEYNRNADKKHEADDDDFPHEPSMGIRLAGLMGGMIRICGLLCRFCVDAGVRPREPSPAVRRRPEIFAPLNQLARSRNHDQ